MEPSAGGGPPRAGSASRSVGTSSSAPAVPLGRRSAPPVEELIVIDSGSDGETAPPSARRARQQQNAPSRRRTRKRSAPGTSAAPANGAGGVDDDVLIVGVQEGPPAARPPARQRQRRQQPRTAAAASRPRPRQAGRQGGVAPPAQLTHYTGRPARSSSDMADVQAYANMLNGIFSSVHDSEGGVCPDCGEIHFDPMAPPYPGFGFADMDLNLGYDEATAMGLAGSLFHSTPMSTSRAGTSSRGKGKRSQARGRNQAVPDNRPAERIKEATFMCAICLEAPEKISSTTCGHVFCRTCILDAIRKNGKCPSCRKEISQGDIHPLYISSA